MDDMEKIVPEAELPTEETPVEVVEETALQTEELSEEELSEEELSEEELETLAEQDALDGEPEESAELPDPVVAMMQEASAAGIDTLAAEERVLATDTALGKAKKQIKIMWGALAGVAVCLVLSLAALGGYFAKDLANMPFKGLQLGKSYKANVELADYTKLTYKDTYVAPTEAEVLTKVNAALKDAKKTDTVKDELKSGDTATIDFTGYIDGEKYDDACGTDVELALGSGQFIPGFEDGLIGKKIGEKVTLNLTFPKDYSEESLQGKAVKFEVTIDSAIRYPKLTDALASELSEKKFDTAEAYEADIYETLNAEKKESAEKDATNDVWGAMLEGSVLKRYPQNMYNSIVEDTDELYSGYYSTYASYGVTDLESFVKIVMQSDLTTYIETQISYHYITYAMADALDITLTDADYEEMLETANVKDRAELEEKYGNTIWRLESDALYRKVTAWMLENATKQ